MDPAKEKKPSSTAAMRRRAEERLPAKTAELSPPRTEEAARKLVHELEVHQIELEMQNEELKRVQEELEFSRNKYVELYDFAPIGYLTLDGQGRIEGVNLTGAHLLGIERGLLLKRPFSSFIAEESDRDIFSKHRREVFQKQGSQTCEIRLKRKKGAAFYAQLLSIAKGNIDGKAGDLFITIRDITESKKTEKKLYAREERYRTHIEVTGQLAWTTNPEGEVTEDIPSWRKYTGQSQEETQGSGWTTALHPDDVRHTLEVWNKAVKTKSAYETEYRIRRQDGIYRHFLVRGVPVVREDGSVREWVGTCVDITALKEVEETLKENEWRLNGAQEIAHLGSWELDLLTNRVRWSDEAYRIFGVQPQEFGLTYETFLETVHPDDRAAVDAAYSGSVREDRDTYELEHRVVRKSTGEIRTVYERCNHLREASGRIIRSVGMVHDITERKKMEERLQKAHEELEDRVEKRTADLKTALSEIQALKDQLEVENIYFRQEKRLRHHVGHILGQSDGLKYVLYRAEQVAPQNTTVLILGETGTGKELIADAIHNLSSRKERPLITVNCAALPANLIESELFGREKGAFTGADTRQVGRFEIAHGSTICLDEIGELPLELQAKLLRVIQHSQFERLGSSQTVKVDVRIVATTNRNLEEEIRQGRFRQDLYYRLNVFPITVPPLRQRKEDIPILVQAFTERYAKKLGKQITSIQKETMKALQEYPWPGNIRELESIIERAVILCPGPVLQLADKLEISSPPLSSAVRTLEETERNQILKTLSETRWRIEGKDGAAAILGLHPSTLRARMHKLGIERPEIKPSDRQSGTP